MQKARGERLKGGEGFRVLQPQRVDAEEANAAWGPGRSVQGYGVGSHPQFKNNYLTEMCSGCKADSYLGRIDFLVTQLHV